MTTTLRPPFLKSRAASAQQWRRRLEIFLAHGPAYLYVYGRWRLLRWVNGLGQAAGTLSDRAFYRCFDLDRPELAAVKETVARDSAADSRLTAYFQTRALPRWFFATEDVSSIAALVPGPLQQTTLKQADDICHNIFQFRRAAPMRFEGGIEWTYQPGGNVDWNWDLNRHLYFETLGRAYAYTGDERYARKFSDLLLDWLARNPPNARHPSWSSVFEVAFRVNTWLWAFYFFRGAAAFDATTCRALLEGLWRHGAALDTQIELHAANNHLLLEAKSLAMLGLTFPEFREAARWRRRGLDLLFREVRAQVCADGVHGERVTLYQQAIAGELLELYIWLDNNRQPLPNGLAEALARMVEFELWVTKPNGQLPLLGDSGLADTHTGFSAAAAAPVWLGRPDLKRPGHELTEMDYWLLGRPRLEHYQAWTAREEALPSRVFREGGYSVMRAGAGSDAAYLVFDVAPFGYARVPVHGHADALSIELHARGQTWLVDPGVYGTWVPAEWRNYFRSTRAHNTVVVDDQDQSVLVGTRLVYRAARVRLHRWQTNERFDLADASHDGYERLEAPITHRRQVLFIKPDYWVVVDQLAGRGEHTFDLYFHFTPGQAVSLDERSGTARAGQPTGPSLRLIPLSSAMLVPAVITGATEPIQGWAAIYSGEKEPAPVLRYRHTGPAPVAFCTVLYPAAVGRPAAVQASSMAVQPCEGADEWPECQVTGLIIETEQFRDRIVLDRGARPADKGFDGHTSRSPLMVIRQIRPGGEIAWQVEG